MATFVFKLELTAPLPCLMLEKLVWNEFHDLKFDLMSHADSMVLMDFSW